MNRNEEQKRQNESEERSEERIMVKKGGTRLKQLKKSPQNQLRRKKGASWKLIRMRIGLREK